ncbi:MAG: vitamin K epoxide reductase family protein [Candidatus Woesearchaeota archaeon]
MLVLPILGILVSYLMLRASTATKKQFCDLIRWSSCSKAAKDSSARLFFGIHNAKVGIFYYIFIILTEANQYTALSMISATLAVVVSTYLAYLLWKKRNLCILCLAAYVINLLIFLEIVFS